MSRSRRWPAERDIRGTQLTAVVEAQDIQLAEVARVAFDPGAGAPHDATGVARVSTVREQRVSAVLAGERKHVAEVAVQAPQRCRRVDVEQVAWLAEDEFALESQVRHAAQLDRSAVFLLADQCRQPEHALPVPPHALYLGGGDADRAQPCA